MRRLGVYLCCSALLSYLLAGVSHAQSAATATIVGRVVDPLDAVVPDAKVTAINTATGVSRSVNTTSSGDYAIPNLSPGTYDIKIQASGFAVGEAKGIKLNVGDQQDLNFKLALAATYQTIAATVEVPLIETTKTDVSTSVTDVDMRRLPTLNGAAGVANDYVQLALSAPGVKLDTSTLSREPIGPGSINNRGNLYNVDGGNITDQINSGRLGGIGASVDEIQEFQVLTNNYNAEYGQAGGLIINAVTKSGDNGIHGDGHMYFRARNLTASNFFYNLGLGKPADGAPRAPFHRKEGGFTLGGPFKKDKLFWFASYELSRQSAPQALTPPSGIINVQQPVNDLVYSGKLQYTPSDKHTLTVRYSVDRQFFDNQVSETGN